MPDSTLVCRDRALSSALSSLEAPSAPTKWVSNPGIRDGNRSRTLILCFDGTGDQFDKDVSNVVHLFSALKKDEPAKQLVYYQSGIGTYVKSPFVPGFVMGILKLADKVFASSLSAHVMDGYRFIMNNYSEGDKICLFGFSRGAYIARALAGMIQRVGLLPSDNEKQVPFAWAVYKCEDRPGSGASAKDFKRTFSIDVKVDFVGVWDTVASVGLVTPELPFISSNVAIRVFRHAVALDERRSKFLPKFPTIPPPSGDNTLRTTDSKQVWFAGGHCDVGGGKVLNDIRYSLARIPLRWMIRECFDNESGIIFDADLLRRKFGLDPDSILQPRPVRLPGTGRSIRGPQDLKSKEEVPTATPTAVNEELEELHDALSPEHDELTLHPLWRVLEYIPIPRMVQDVGQRRRLSVRFNLGRRRSVYGGGLRGKLWRLLEYLPIPRMVQDNGQKRRLILRLNLGRGRNIYGDALKGNLLVHRSVLTRVEASAKSGKEYRPRAWFEMSEVLKNRPQARWRSEKHLYELEPKSQYVGNGPRNIDPPAPQVEAPKGATEKEEYGRQAWYKLWATPKDPGPKNWNVKDPDLWVWKD